MTDAEWQRWQQTFRRKEGVMPQIVKQVRRARLGIAFGQALFAVIVLGETAFGIHGVVSGALASERLASAFVLAFVAAMSALFVANTRGMHRRVQQTPEALLGYMEQTFRTQERAGALARWGGVVVCTFTAGFVTWDYGHGRGTTADLALGLAVVAFTLGATWATPLFVRRKIAKKRAQVEAWKKELSEP